MTLKVLTSYIAQCDGPDSQTPCAHSNTLTFYAFPDQAMDLIIENKWTYSPQVIKNTGFLGFGPGDSQPIGLYRLHCYSCTLLKQASEAPAGAFDPF